MLHFKIQVRLGDPSHRARSNDGWEDRADVRGTEAQALDLLQDYQCGRRTIITESSDNEFRLIPVRPINLTASGAP